MILVVNIGNSNIRFGISSQEKIMISWVENSKPHKTKEEFLSLFSDMYSQYGIKKYKEIYKIILGSVVPELTIIIKEALEEFHQIKVDLVTRETASEISHSSNQIGTDLYANAAAAHHLYSGLKLIIDFGTALTLTAIDEKGKLLGVIIAPGVSTALKSLVNETSQLPEIQLEKPKMILGMDTITCMQSGMIYGFLGMIEGWIDRVLDSFEEEKFATVISTGGLSHIYAPLTDKIHINDRLHTLKGLLYLGK